MMMMMCVCVSVCVCVCVCVCVSVCACINSRLGKTKWVEICTYCLASSAGLGGPQWSQSEREMETALLFVKLPNADAPGTTARVMKSQTRVMFELCLIPHNFLSRACFPPTNSFRTLACEWFTAKRNALWISLLFNLSQRPLKTGSNALISYSEERLIYRYACHLLLRRLHKQSPTLSLMFESKSQRPIHLPFRVARAQRGFVKWLQYINRNENNYALWGSIFIHVTTDHKGSSVGVNRAVRNVLSGRCKEWRTVGYYIDKVLFWSLENGCPPPPQHTHTHTSSAPSLSKPTKYDADHI